MFQYTKENILNKVDENTFKTITEGGVDKLVVEGFGEYIIENIVDDKVYRTPGKVGNAASVSFTLAQLTGEHVLSFRVVTSKALAEFASPNWNVFGKPMIIGYNATTLDEIKEAIELALEGNKLIKVEITGTDDKKLVLTGTDKYMSFDKIALDDTPLVPVAKVTNVEPFATKEWIIENLRFPTYPNIRYTSVGNIPTNDLYDEISFAYAVPRVGLGGLSGVGQGLTAVTRHIFYIPANATVSFTPLTVDGDSVDEIDNDDIMLDNE